MNKHRRFVWTMSSPAMLVLILLTIFPIIFTIYCSFTDYYFLNKTQSNFIGLKNFIDLFKDRYFIQASLNTLKFVLLAVFCELILGIFIAVFVDSLKHIGKVMRVVILLPALIPPVTVALIWQMMMSNNNGILNRMLNTLGINGINWLLSPEYAFSSVLLIDIWQYTPVVFLIIFAALQAIPDSQFEAAKIDGVNTWQKFIYITLPNIKEALYLAVIMRMVDTFRLFDKVNILTKGGPAGTTSTMTQYIYQHGVNGLNLGFSSAASIIMTLSVLIFITIYTLIIKSKNDGEKKSWLKQL